MKTKNMPNQSFREFVEATRVKSTEILWSRAKTASKLRHLAAAHGKTRSARTLAKVKEESIRHAAALLPEEIKVTIDRDYQIGLPSVRWRGHGRMHLPAGVVLAEKNNPHAFAC